MEVVKWEKERRWSGEEGRRDRMGGVEGKPYFGVP